MRPLRFLETPGTKCPVAQRHVPEKPMPYAALIRIMLFYLAFHFRHINHLKPSGFFKYHLVYYSKLLHVARFALSVLYGSQNRQRPFLYTSLAAWFFITVVERVYSAVRTDSLYKADYVSSLKR